MLSFDVLNKKGKPLLDSNLETQTITSIREAELKDVPYLISMGMSFFKQSGYENIFSFDKDSFLKTVEHLISDDTGTIFIVTEDDIPVGMAGALMFPFYMNSNVLSCQELFWWINPESRKGLLATKLLKGVETWAKDRGAHTFMMMCLEHLEPEKVERLLTIKGYNKTERHFMRVL